MEKSDTSELADHQRLTCLLALLDDIIKKDKERTQGEWKAEQNKYRQDQWWIVADEGDLVETYPQEPYWIGATNASFIACASVSHGRNARIAKLAILCWQADMRNYSYTHDTYRNAKDNLDGVASLYPDEILKRYLK